MEHKMHEKLRYFPPGQVIETESGSHIILRVELGWGGEEMRAASPDKAAAAPAAAAVYEKLTLRVSHVPGTCMAYAWRAHGSVRGSVRAPLAAACCLPPDPLL